MNIFQLTYIENGAHIGSHVVFGLFSSICCDTVICGGSIILKFAHIDRCSLFQGRSGSDRGFIAGNMA